MRRISGQALRFLVVGGLNTLLTYAIFFLLGLVLPAWLAYTIAYAVGLVWVAVGTSRLVFDFRGSWQRPVLFAAWYLALYGIGQLVIAIIAPRDPAALAVTSLAILIVTVPLSFLGGRLLFRDRAEGTEPSKGAEPE
jgi:putative flippase GtrA